jgi:hypothetical protein
MKNSDQGKYRSLMTSLTTQFSMGTNQYPEDILKAVNILTNHRFDKREPKNHKDKNKNRNNNNTASTITTQSSFSIKKMQRVHSVTVVARKAITQTSVPRKGRDPRINGQ